MPRTEVFNREQVVAQARDVFWTKGYNGTSMQDLVDATGLNRSSIYNSFGSKMELYQLCLSSYQGSNFEYIQMLFDSAKSPLEGIQKFFANAVVQITTDKKGKGCMIVNCNTEMANQDLDLAHWVGNNQSRMVALFKKAIIQAQEQGQLNTNKDPQVLASYLVSFTQGLRISGTNNKNKKMLQAMVRHVLSTLN